MHSSLIFCSILMAALVVLTVSRPTATLDMIRIMARTTINRIKKIKDEHFRMSPEIYFPGPDIDTPIDGLTSVIVHLRYVQIRLQVPPSQHLRQVQVDLETLLSTLEGLAISHGCPLPNHETPVHKAETAFPFTFNYLYLQELQRFLDKLCLNMEKLKRCKDTDVAETLTF
ncbi:leptin b [Triplophysa rosa]|uniref:Leptin n=1 Tax=Triplophysa rosa TaxID=992332 RepID=A0A9W7W958_TRIRA|nr:leptin b [Triplophysa rosa]KAI7791806.1 leptin B [Triplophysa rosa]